MGHLQGSPMSNIGKIATPHQVNWEKERLSVMWMHPLRMPDDYKDTQGPRLLLDAP